LDPTVAPTVLVGRSPLSKFVPTVLPQLGVNGLVCNSKDGVTITAAPAVRTPRRLTAAASVRHRGIDVDSIACVFMAFVFLGGIVPNQVSDKSGFGLLLMKRR
jgi:hypothetical protein